MPKIIIFGNSGSGKSTLAKHLALKHQLAHLDLDTIAWSDIQPPQRLPIDKSKFTISQFIQANDGWVIEGCYADLLALVISEADEVIFLNLSIQTCIENAKNRPWEPHKYETKAAQDANLSMLVKWIAEYENRTDTFSKFSHEQLFNEYEGKKVLHTANKVY